MDSAEVKAYIMRLPLNEPFTELSPEDQEKFIFNASEMLERRVDASVITYKMIGLQALFMAEGEGEEWAKMKRQGIKSMGMDGMSFSFDSSHVSPEVAIMIEKILNPPEPVKRNVGAVGRLV